MNFIEDVAALHALGLTGAGVSVGHLDSGVDPAAPLLQGRIGRTAVVSQDGLTLETGVLGDDTGHGTFTAELIGGAAPGARLAVCRAIEGGAVVARLLHGLDWLAGQRPEIISVSAGVPGRPAVFASILAELARRDVLVIAAAGNLRVGRGLWPALEPAALAVGCYDAERGAMPFSSSAIGEDGMVKPDLLAPGRAATAGEDPGATGGTSASAAQVAGIAALLRADCPGASAHAVRRVIEDTAAEVPHASRHRARHGVVRPLAALEALRKSKEQVCAPTTPPPIARTIDSQLLLFLRRCAADKPREVIIQFAAASDAAKWRRHARAYEVPYAMLQHVPVAIARLPLDAIDRLVRDPAVISLALGSVEVSEYYTLR